MNLTNREKEILLEFLGELSNRFSYDGCNDYELENTPENYEIVRQAEESQGIYNDLGYIGEDRKPDVSKNLKKIYADNGAILDYLIEKIKNE